MNLEKTKMDMDGETGRQWEENIIQRRRFLHSILNVEEFIISDPKDKAKLKMIWVRAPYNMVIINNIFNPCFHCTYYGEAYELITREKIQTAFDNHYRYVIPGYSIS